jgi:hypothetical protein
MSEVFYSTMGRDSQPAVCCCDSLLPTEAEEQISNLKPYWKEEPFFLTEIKELNEFILKIISFLVKIQNLRWKKMMLSKRVAIT